jgi:hypothetical protein
MPARTRDGYEFGTQAFVDQEFHAR